ncbi:choline ABC transporter permease [Lactiplantibacillus plantarum]|nr:choline ABC transporter permease [Lactiplantibacillus plantarum]
MITFLQNYGMQLLVKTWQHLYISAFSLFLGIIVAVPIGILLTRVKPIANVVMSIASMLQTIPAMALLALMIPFFGIGAIPAIIALFIYSLLPILRNTYLGLEDVDPALIDAAKGMGMTGWQSIVKVELPMAAPVIMAGIRLSATYVIAWAALASYIGAGGLGDFIFNGLNLYRTDLILGGSILRNTYLGLEDVDPALIDAAKGMGMTGWQSIVKVELPMAAPVIMAGIRLSATYVIAWAALASYIGAGGLGDFIFNGLNLYRTDLILGGSIPVIILALIVDWLLGKLEAAVTPRTTQA